MKNRIALTGAVLLAATLAAAQAQDGFGGDGPGSYDIRRGASLDDQIWGLEHDLDQADRRGALSDQEASSLAREIRALRNWYEMSARNGLSYQENRYLQDRVDRIRDRLPPVRYGQYREDEWRGNDGNGNWRDPSRDGDPAYIDRDEDDDGVADRVDSDRDNDGIPNDDDPNPDP